MAVKVNLNHIGITVSNLEESLAFYQKAFDLIPGMKFEVTANSAMAETLGLPEHRQKVALIPIDGVMIELIEFHPHRKEFDGRQDDIGYAYLSFIVDDLDEVHANLTAAGFKFNTKPLAGNEDPPFTGSKVCVLKDPDGKNIEFVQHGPGMHYDRVAERSAARDPYVTTYESK